MPASTDVETLPAVSDETAGEALSEPGVFVPEHPTANVETIAKSAAIVRPLSGTITGPDSLHATKHTIRIMANCCRLYVEGTNFVTNKTVVKVIGATPEPSLRAVTVARRLGFRAVVASPEAVGLTRRLELSPK